ncbi:MAG: hypothetical protein ACPGYP_03425 [Solirubrobacterales bacterium]
MIDLTPVVAADTGGNYVAAAFLVFVVVLIIYLAIMANKLVKIQQTLTSILRRIDEEQSD